jgi:hypothetical protein
MTVSETRERLRKIAEEDQRQNLMGYSADGGAARHRLENQRSAPSTGGGFPAWPPRNVFIHPEGGGWIVEADGREFAGGTELEARNKMRAHYGQAPLREERRNPMDDAPKAGEE